LFSSGTLCPHQESDYLAEHTFQKTDVMADVAGFYAAFGLRVSGQHRELPDFLGTELEFLHWAAEREAAALQEGNEEAAAVCRQARETFLSEHLGSWVTPFRERIERSPGWPFYVALARLIESYVKGRPGLSHRGL
jgi:DMSO reductase family type II enzyme chaperone